MQRPVDAIRLECGVDGLRKAGFGEADGFRTFDVEKNFKVRRREMLHDRIVREIFQHLFAAGLRNVRGDEDEMQFAFVRAQRITANQQSSGFQHEREKPLDTFCGNRIFRWRFVAHHATFTLTLWPLISARFSLAIMPLTCSLDTSTNECRSRTSTVPTTLPGNPVSPATELTKSMGTTPCSLPTLIQRRVWSGGVARLGFGFGAAAGADLGLMNNFDSGFGSGVFTEARISASGKVFTSSGFASLAGRVTPCAPTVGFSTTTDRGLPAPPSTGFAAGVAFHGAVLDFSCAANFDSARGGRSPNRRGRSSRRLSKLGRRSSRCGPRSRNDGRSS